jgi:Cu(I)/Ag(I) efflux system membrane fusion protein
VLDPETRTVKVRVNVPNPDGRLKPGMFVRAVVSSRIAAGGKVMDADLAGKWISPMHPEIVKNEPGTCDVCGMPLVRTESLGYVRVDPEKADKPLVIPASAPLVTGTRAVVYVEIPGTDRPTYEGREVVLGPRAGDYYLVRAGLSEGQIVVTRGNFKIDSALQISARPSMMSPDIAARSEDKKPGKDLPKLFTYQLRRVLAAAGAARDAVSAGRTVDEIHAAFNKLGSLVEAVDAKALQGRPAMLWREYAMRLSNDAAEGSRAKSPKEMDGTARSLKRNARALRAALGLTGEDLQPPAPAVDARFLTQLGAVYRVYLAVRKALAADDLPAAQEAAERAAGAMAGVDMQLVKGEDHTAWMKSAGSLKQMFGDMAKAGSIEDARKAFALCSEQMAALAGRFGSPTGGVLYRIKCPMAFDNRGAIWLQSKKDVSNPYFGNAMLRCGEVRDVFEPPQPKAAGKDRRDE